MWRFKGLVDVCGGKMKLGDISGEILFYIALKKPQRLIVDIERREDGYYTTIYLSKEDFRKEVSDEDFTDVIDVVQRKLSCSSGVLRHYQVDTDDAGGED